MDSRTVAPSSLAAPVSLKTFSAYMLEPALVSDPSSVRLFARPWNAVSPRIQNWQRRGRITVDSNPALYLHEYTADGTTIRGWVGLLDVRPHPDAHACIAVIPHEETQLDQAEELAVRMEQMSVQPAPILLTVKGSPTLQALTRQVVETTPTRQYADWSGHLHRIWSVRDAALITQINDELSVSRALIADGHHRYAAYSRLQARHPNTDYDFGLAMIVDQSTTPFNLAPIHRVLFGISLNDLQTAASHIDATFEYRPGPVRPPENERDIVATNGTQWAVLTLPHHDHHTIVETLHAELLPKLPAFRIERHVKADYALTTISETSGVVLLMPAASVGDVLTTALAGQTLPEKATSFRPKPPHGALFRVIHHTNL